MPNERKIDSIRNSKRPFKLLDIAVFVLVIGLAVFILVFSFSKDASYVEISYNGVSQKYSLEVDREIIVKEGFVVVIKDGGCFVKETDCKDKICKNSGIIKRVNQIIVCAPHGIIIKIVGNAGNEL